MPSRRLKWSGMLLALLLAPAASPADGSPVDAKATKELGRFQGTWAPVHIERGDQAPCEMDREYLRATKIVFEGNSFRCFIDGELHSRSTFTIDPTRNPKQIDAATVDDQEVIAAIYAFDGDTLKLCCDNRRSRPTCFTTKGFPTRKLLVFKREKSTGPMQPVPGAKQLDPFLPGPDVRIRYEGEERPPCRVGQILSGNEVPRADPDWPHPRWRSVGVAEASAEAIYR